MTGDGHGIKFAVLLGGYMLLGGGIQMSMEEDGDEDWGGFFIGVGSVLLALGHLIP